MATLTSARALFPLAAMSLLWLVGACPTASGATRRTVSTTCSQHTHARRCRNPLINKRTTRVRTLASPTAVSPGGCANTTVLPNAGNLPLIASAILCLVNAQRTQSGLARLRANAHLTGAAQRHSSDMAGSGLFNHVGSAGDTFADRIGSSGYLQAGRSFTAGENIAWAATRRSTASTLVAQWMGSAEHRMNILSPAYRDTGIAMSLAPPSPLAGGGRGTTITEDFGALQ
jgi:uncharacterized protein YkwD